MKYRWNKGELYLKYLLSYIYNDLNYRFIINSLLNQYNLSKPKSHIEKYSLDESDYTFAEKQAYFYAGLDLIPTSLIAKVKNIYLTWKDIEYFHQKFQMPKRYFTDKELMTMLDYVIESTNNSDILRTYHQLITRKSHTYNIQNGNKNSKGELLITGLTIYDQIFNKNYINILREYNAGDFITLTHETMHAIFNLLLHEHGLTYYDQILFAELEGNLGSLLAFNYLNDLGYKADIEICQIILIDTLIFLSSALLIGDLVFSSSESAFDMDTVNEKAKIIIPQDRSINIKENLEDYIKFPALDIIIDIIDYATTLELMERGTDEAIKSIIDIKLNNNNELMPTLEKHNLTFPKDDFAILTKEFTKIK